MLALPLLAHAQQSRHTADDGEAGDRFGSAVTISDDGQRALVGAYRDAVDGNDGQGSAYVFTRDESGTFAQEAKLVAEDGAAGDSLGGPGSGGGPFIPGDEAVSINADGTVALVGAYTDDVDGTTNQGSAYIFVREDGGTWTQEAKLTAERGAEDDHFGSSVSISDDGQRALVGAELDEGADGTTDQGSAYVFTRESGGTWTQEARLSSDALAGKSFPNAGDAVSLSGNGERALVGAFLDDLSGDDSNEGSAAVFTRSSDGSWTEEATLTADDAEPADFFGGAVSLSDDGTRALVGAYLDEGSDGTTDKGSAYVFSRDGSGNWTQEVKLTTDAVAAGNDFTNFGNAVSLSGDGSRALVGAFLGDPNGVTDAGSAFVFDRAADGWEEGPTITADDAAEFDQFGISVSISEDGQQAIVGSHLDEVDGNTDQGSVYALGPTSLPVELTSFTARRDGKDASLEWRTVSETNNSGFELQRRSASSESWQEVAFVESKAVGGTNTETLHYSYRVEDLANGQHTFRLIQVDTDGTQTPGGIERTVEIGLEARYELSKVSPNPVDERGRVDVTVREAQEVTVALFDVLGRQVRVLHDGPLAGNKTKRLAIDSSTLPSGVYFLRMQGEDFSTNQKVVLTR